MKRDNIQHRVRCQYLPTEAVVEPDNSAFLFPDLQELILQWIDRFKGSLIGATNVRLCCVSSNACAVRSRFKALAARPFCLHGSEPLI
jgi:hypothetical protein